MAIPVHKPFIKRREMDAVLTCLVSDLGPSQSQSSLLIKDCLEFFQAEAGLALREYRRAIELALQALALPDKSRIALSALAPATYLTAILSLGHQPVLIDVLEANPTMSLQALQHSHQDQALAAIVAHQTLGFLTNPAVAELGLPIIEDLTQAFGQPGAGQLGSLLVLGLEVDAIITAGGGTLVLAKTGRAADRLAAAVADQSADVYLSDMNAALGRTQFLSRDQTLQRRRELAEMFNRAIMRCRHRLLSPQQETNQPNYACCLLARSGVPDIVQYAGRKQIETALAFAGAAISTWPADRQATLPFAQALFLRCLLFPLHPGLRKKEIEIIEKVLASLP